MENALSQADIDALMKALLPANGAELFALKGSQVKAYDFRRPSKFNKELLRTLVMVHDNYARLLQSFFLAQLRTRAEVTVRSTNQYLFAEYIQLLPSPGIILTFRLNPLPGVCLMEVSLNIAYAIVDRVFGGPVSETQPQRGLSDIELGVIQRLAMEMFQPMAEAWRNVADLKPTLKGVETNPMFVQVADPSEVLAVVTLAVRVGEHMGHVTFGFPFSTVEPVLARLSGQTWGSAGRRQDDTELKQLQENIQGAPVRVQVLLGTARISLGDFMNLQVGHVITLDTRTSAELPVFVGDCLTFLARPGVVGDRMSIQIHRSVPGRTF